MKKPNVLNRAMFNQGGTSAYGKGITSNLVSDEQRQGYNYGGRVGYQNRGYVNYMGPTYQTTDPSKMYGQSKYLTPWPKSEEDLRTFNKYQFDKIPRWQDVYSDVYETEDIPDIEEYGIEKPYLSASEEERQDIEFKRKMDERNLKIKEMKDVGLVIPGEGATPAQEFGTSVVEEEIEGPFGGEPGTPIPGERDPSLAHTSIKEEPTDTDILDVDRWAFLDENIAKKKKLARGHALMEGAAAAADFAVAATPEKRGAAVSKGLRSVGTIGAKYKGDAEDIKTKAQILGTVEEIKGEQKQKLWQDRLKGYYQPSLDIAEQGLALKKAAAELAAEGKDGLSIYDDILLTDSKSLRDPFTKRDILRSLTGKNLSIENEKNKKTLNSKENVGLIFIDINGNVVRNKGDGTTEDVDETRDEFFTWRT